MASYMTAYNDYANKLNQMAEQQKNSIRGVSAQKQRNAYVENQLMRRSIPQGLSNAGITGGAVEKAVNNANITYKNNLANIKADEAQNVADIDRDNANAVNEAYKQAIQLDTERENQERIAAQQAANAWALADAQIKATEAREKQAGIDNTYRGLLLQGYSDVRDNSGKLYASEAAQLANLYKQAKSEGASDYVLNSIERAAVDAATARYVSNPDNVTRKKANTLDAYLNTYVYDRLK